MSTRGIDIFGAVLIAALVLFGGLATSPARAESAGCGTVEREMAYGRVALQDAKNRRGFLESARQFQAAVNKAPRCAMAHFNLGVVYEKAGVYGKALSAFQTYLRLVPGAADAKAVKNKIYELEYRIKRAGQARRTSKKSGKKRRRQARTRKPKARTKSWAKLNGRWCQSNLCTDPRFRAPVHDFVVSISGSRIDIRTTEPVTTNLKSTRFYSGTISPSGSIRGSMSKKSLVVRGACTGRTLLENRSSVTGAIRFGDFMDAKGRMVRGPSIVLRYQTPGRTDYDYGACKAVVRSVYPHVLILRKR